MRRADEPQALDRGPEKPRGRNALTHVILTGSQDEIDPGKLLVQRSHRGGTSDGGLGAVILGAKELNPAHLAQAGRGKLVRPDVLGQRDPLV